MRREKKYPANFISKDLKEEEGGKINPTHVLQSLYQPLKKPTKLNTNYFILISIGIYISCFFFKLFKKKYLTNYDTLVS